jgi:hypothetical protein
MIEFKTAEYHAYVDDNGLLKLFRLSQRHLTVTRFEGGVETVEIVGKDNADESTRKLLSFLQESPVCIAAYRKNDRAWECDIDAGFQRWHGYKSGAVISTALRNCGFDPVQIRALLAAGRRHDDVYCPRVH